MSERLVLVDAADRAVGVEEKMRVHQLGLLHRAFSVFVFNSRGQLLLQQRALDKYHSGGLWTNTCCGHPRPDELVVNAAERRLTEEMGIRTALRQVGSFQYHAPVAPRLVEHEYDHLLLGAFEGEPRPNPAEVVAWRWVKVADVQEEMRQDPAAFTCWFPLALERLIGLGEVAP